MNSVIRYYGGKGSGLAMLITKYFPLMSEYDTYLEAFGGGASVLFSLEPVPIEIYNDIESNVYALFKTISDKDAFVEFKEKCDLALYSRELHNEYRESLKSELTLHERAFRYFYVNKTSFNGCGGFTTNSSIRRKMSKSVSYMLSTVDNLWNIHNRLSKVIVENTDALELMEKYNKKRTVMYLDPPYHHSTRSGARYVEDMTNEQQTKFIDKALTLAKSIRDLLMLVGDRSFLT